MSGHKKYIQSLNPITLITFDDSATWERESGELLYTNEIFDESINGVSNNALLHSEYDVVRSSYRMGQRSMVNNQPTNNYSIVLAPYEFDSKNTFEFSKTWIEIPHTDEMLFKKEFTFAFLYNKAKNDRDVLGRYIWNAGQNKYLIANSNNGYNYASMKRTIIKKGNVSLTWYMPHGNEDELQISFFNNSGVIKRSAIPGGFYSRDMYIVMSQKYILLDDGRYYTQSRVYIDNRIIYEHNSNPIYGEYDASNTASIEIGGNQLAYDYNSLDDRTTSITYYDQIAIFDYCLEDFQVANLYKKVYGYEEMIIRSFPTYYYKMNELHADQVFYNSMSNDNIRNLQYIGGHTQIVKEKPGVHGVYGSTRTDIMNRGMLYCKPMQNGYYIPYFNPSSDFSIEFFASFNTTGRGLLFSIQDDTTPFRGVALFVNSRNNQHKSGSIQLSITETDYINTLEKDARDQSIMYNDGIVRHYAIIRRGNYVELWINAVFISKIYMSTGALTRELNQLFMFGLMPGNLDVNGSLQHMAIYTRSLSSSELSTRAAYMKRYVIDGKVTVKGVPKSLGIRVYNFNSGELVMKSKSNNDGLYSVIIPSDDYINVVFMDPGNINIRPRIIGPTLADEYEDVPFE